MTLLPGLIEAHTHIFLHAYNETLWNDQVLKESEAYRTIEAVRHCEPTLLAGFTTIRDLGTEGAGYADVAVQRAINEGLIPGPRLFVATRAIVATASYGPGPAGFAPNFDTPKGAPGSERHSRGAQGRARADGPRRRLGEGVRGLPPRHRAVGADLQPRRTEGAGRRGAQRRQAGLRPRLDRRRACAARWSPAWTRSSTATAAPTRCSG